MPFAIWPATEISRHHSSPPWSESHNGLASQQAIALIHVLFSRPQAVRLLALHRRSIPVSTHLKLSRLLSPFVSGHLQIYAALVSERLASGG